MHQSHQMPMNMMGGQQNHQPMQNVQSNGIMMNNNQQHQGGFIHCQPNQQNMQPDMHKQNMQMHSQSIQHNQHSQHPSHKHMPLSTNMPGKDQKLNKKPQPNIPINPNGMAVKKSSNLIGDKKIKENALWVHPYKNTMRQSLRS